jgi:hypothetical protein
MTIGDAYLYKNKFDALEAKYTRLKEQYGEQQAIIEAYQKHWNDRHSVQHVPFGFEWPHTSV